MAGKKVYIIGAGPSRPDLISLRGYNILKQADVIIYDQLADKKVLEAAKKGAELVPAGEHEKKQERICRLMVIRAMKGKKVVRLKNGDPSVFGRLAEELKALKDNGIGYEIVPGITAASAAAAYCGVPLTERNLSSSVAIVTGHESRGKKKSFVDWGAVSKLGTIVLYMAFENLGTIADKLILNGRSKRTPVVVVYHATAFDQRTVRGNLGDIAKKAKAAGLKAPATVIIGDVAGHGEKHDWRKSGKKVLFTGLSNERFFLEGDHFHLPMIKIEPLGSYQEFDSFMGRLEKFDWIIFSSRYGVEYFFERLLGTGLDSRAFKEIKVASVGLSTSGKLKSFGINADLVPKNECAAGLLEEFGKFDMKGQKVFLVRSHLSDKGLEDGLKKLGARVSSSVAYRNVMPDDLPDLDIEKFDEILFTSPSTARNFRKRYGVPPKKVKRRWIGEATKKQMIKEGLI